MLANHIYQRKEVVDNYNKTRDMPTRSLYNWLNKIIENYVLLNPKKDIKFLEVGVGTGMISFPIIDILSRKANRWLFYGVDNSKNMLKVFVDNLKTKNVYKTFYNRIKILYGDIEKEPALPNRKFDFILLGGVLHCLKNPERTLKFLKSKLKKNGILIIIIEPDSFIKLIAGDIEKDGKYYNQNIPKWIIMFWKTYHHHRHDLNSPIDKRTELIYSVKKVKNIVNSIGGLSYLGYKDLVWSKNISADYFIDIIRKRLYFAIGQNLSKSKAIRLAHQMKFWLRKNKNCKDFSFLCVRRGLLWKRIF